MYLPAEEFPHRTALRCIVAYRTKKGDGMWGRKRRIALTTALLVVAALVVPVATAGAAGHAEIVTTFDAEAGELSEGVAVDKIGNVFVSLAPLGQVLKFAPGSSDFELFGSIPGWTGEGAGLLGLAVDAKGNVYAAAQSTGSTGVWKFDRKTGAESLIPGTDQMTFPNSLAFDKKGNLYATDSFSGGNDPDFLGAIYRIARDGTVEKWLESTLLGGTGALGPGVVGVNGISFRQDTIYVANSEKFSVMSIQVLKDGSAGDISTLAQGFDLFIPDGIAVDVHGGIYVAVIGLSAIKRVNPDGSIDTIAEGAGDFLDLPSSLAFGTGAGMKQTLYAVNLALVPEIGTGIGPALVAIDVGVPGMPLP
jgi:sugar lactone lactonase YvrE